MIKFFFKYKKGLLPAYFNRMFEESFLDHEHNTRHKNDPVPNIWKSVAAKNSIRIALPAAIKQFPKNILDKIEIEDYKLDAFSKAVKLHLIDEYETKCFIKDCFTCINNSTDENSI